MANELEEDPDQEAILCFMDIGVIKMKLMTLLM